MVMVNMTRGLPHVNVSVNFPVEVGGGDVHLMDWPCLVCSDSKHYLDAGHLGNWGKGLGVINCHFFCTNPLATSRTL